MKRLTHFDGLRGLAALAIAVHHSLYILRINEVWGMWHHRLYQPLTLQAKLTQLLLLVFNGRAVVAVFFILSGLVTHLSLEKKGFEFSQTGNYYIKRFLRLYPVYFLITLLTVLYISIGFKHQRFTPYSGEWFGWWFDHKITFQEIVNNLTFVTISLSGVAWYLRVELLASLCMPLCYFVSRKTSVVVDILLMLLFAYVAYFTLHFPDLSFVSLFYLGLTLPKWKSLFTRRYFLLVAIIFLTFPRMTITDTLAVFFEAVGAFLLIGTVFYHEIPKLNAFLNSRFLQFYGKISFSFFLLHFLVLYITSVFIFQHVPHAWLRIYPLPIMIGIAFTSILITTPLSFFILTCIEKPILRLSTRLL